MLTKHIDFIKYQLDRTRKLLRKQESKGAPAASLPAIISQFEECLAAMQSADEALKLLPFLPGKQKDRTSLAPADIAGLPPELLSQLSLSEGDLQDFEIHAIVADCGGVMSIDHILIEMFRRKGDVADRSKVNSRLYRMVQKGLLFDVPKRRGVYSTYPVKYPEVTPPGKEDSAQ